MSRKDVIRELVTLGHSPAKALEVALDRERGLFYAIEWVALAIKTNRAV